MGVFNKTIIPLALVGYEMIIANWAYAPRWLSIISYPTRPRGIIVNYYINTNEIPSELSREILISSQVKISPLLWLHNKYFSTLEEKFCISVQPCNILYS